MVTEIFTVEDTPCEGFSFSMEGLWEGVSIRETSRLYLQYFCGSSDTLVASFLIPVTDMVNSSVRASNGFVPSMPHSNYTHISFCPHWLALTVCSWYFHMCNELQRSSCLWGSISQNGAKVEVRETCSPLTSQGTIQRRPRHQTCISAMFSGGCDWAIFFSCYWKLVLQHRLKPDPSLGLVVFVSLRVWKSGWSLFCLFIGMKF